MLLNLYVHWHNRIYILVKLSDVMIRARDGEAGKPERGKIGFASLRGGEVVCENTVYFAGPGQRLEITSQWVAQRPCVMKS